MAALKVDADFCFGVLIWTHTHMFWIRWSELDMVAAPYAFPYSESAFVSRCWVRWPHVDVALIIVGVCCGGHMHVHKAPLAMAQYTVCTPFFALFFRGAGFGAYTKRRR